MYFWKIVEPFFFSLDLIVVTKGKKNEPNSYTVQPINPLVTRIFFSIGRRSRSLSLSSLLFPSLFETIPLNTLKLTESAFNE